MSKRWLAAGAGLMTVLAAAACTPRGPLVATTSPSPAARVSASPSASSLHTAQPSEIPSPSPSPVVTGPGTWLRGKLMSVPRADFAAATLPSGKVLLIGGQTSATADTATVDLFDPISNSITSSAPMATPRHGHIAILLPTGKVLTAGGAASPTGPALASAELYDPTTNAWIAAAAMAQPRAHPTAILMSNGKVLVSGGDGGLGPNPNSSEIYDPATNTWTSVPLGQPRTHGPTATALSDGRIMIAMGLQAWHWPVSTVEFYDPAPGTRLGGSTAQPDDRWYTTAASVGDGRVIVVGGQDASNPSGALNTTWIYDPSKDVGNTGMPAWSVGPAMNVGHCHNTITTLAKGPILVAGGRCGPSESIAVAEILDTTAMTWMSAGSMQDPRGFHIAVALADGRVLVAGGFSPGGSVGATTELYSPA